MQGLVGVVRLVVVLHGFVHVIQRRQQLCVEVFLLLTLFVFAFRVIPSRPAPTIIFVPRTHDHVFLQFPNIDFFPVPSNFPPRPFRQFTLKQ